MEQFEHVSSSVPLHHHQQLRTVLPVYLMISAEYATELKAVKRNVLYKYSITQAQLFPASIQLSPDLRHMTSHNQTSRVAQVSSTTHASTEF
jgi:hypothetical protein